MAHTRHRNPRPEAEKPIQLSSERKARVERTIERNLMTLANEARRIGIEEAIGVLKLVSTREEALKLLFERVTALKAMEEPSEPVYTGDIDDEKDRDS